MFGKSGETTWSVFFNSYAYKPHIHRPLDTGYSTSPVNWIYLKLWFSSLLGSFKNLVIAWEFAGQGNNIKTAPHTPIEACPIFSDTKRLLLRHSLTFCYVYTPPFWPDMNGPTIHILLCPLHLLFFFVGGEDVEGHGISNLVYVLPF